MTTRKIATLEEEVVLAGVLEDANNFVRQLRLPAQKRHLYDDIVQDTMIVAHRRLPTLCTFGRETRRSWTRATMFLVARNTQRAEFRRTATWERLRDAFKNDTIRDHFEQVHEKQAAQLANALASLTPLDRDLLIGQVWEGLTLAELAGQHGLTVHAVRNRLTRARTSARRNFQKSETSSC